MKKIRLIWPGRTKEQFIAEGVQKYLGLLRPYANIEIRELRGSKGDDAQKIREQEGERIMKEQAAFFLLDEHGRHFTSVEFAGFLENQPSPVSFVIGGAFGVSDSVKAAAKSAIALSRMTFTHEMSRMILLEQIYRAFTIQQKRGYHH